MCYSFKMTFLPMTTDEMLALGWDQCDAIIVTGDAYVDHPAFGAAVIGRVLQAAGYRVGIIAQPDWRGTADFMKLGRPRLFFGVTAGNIDSMLHHYTAAKKLRHDDPYSPGGRHGLRPNRALIVYANKLREAYKDAPIVLGGIEASLRRLAHYDYWDDAVRRSVLVDAKADLLVYGMGESAIKAVARALDAECGIQNAALRSIPGTAAIIKGSEIPALPEQDRIELPSFEDVQVSRDAFNLAFVTTTNEANPFTGKALLQRHGDRAVLCHPPALPLDTGELDAVYELPYQRAPHPSYTQPVPALETVKWSIVSHRGCYGGCSFCTLYFHQGPVIQSRSAGSVVREATALAARKDFRGVISDIGGPTANMYGTNCRDGKRASGCRHRSCLAPRPCDHLDADQSPSLRLWQEVLRVPGVRQVFVASGVRHDLALRDPRYLRELIAHRTGGHLKVAPEHCSPRVLQAMNKPPIGDFVAFLDTFRTLSAKEQYLVPYLISSHPGCGYDDMLELQEFLKQHRIRVEQVQDFIPLPMTASAAMYHTGKDPFSGAKLYVERSADGKLRQRALLAREGRESWETQERRASAGMQQSAKKVKKFAPRRR